MLKNVDLYIMANEENVEKIQTFFEEHNYFSYDKKHIFFFSQPMHTKHHFDGEPMLDKYGNPRMAPGGNGLWIDALRRSRFATKMKKDGAKWINLLSVDNPLYTIVDVTFLGALIEYKGDMGVQVVEKKNPEERVGVICKNENGPYVKEYYELTDEEKYQISFSVF